MQIIENLIIIVIFGAAIRYLALLLFKNIKGEKKCSSQCGGACNSKFEFEPTNLPK
jgi:hypothetical protein